jgi:hypothetical protein
MADGCYEAAMVRYSCLFSLLLLGLGFVGCTRPAVAPPRASVPETDEGPEVIQRCAVPVGGAPEFLPDGGFVAGADAGSGWIMKEDIRQVVRKNIGEMRRCYEETLERNASAAGKVPVRFVIAPSGEVCAARAVESTVSDVAMANCVVRAVSRLRFPTIHGDGHVLVTYPFIFKVHESARDAGTALDGGFGP